MKTAHLELLRKYSGDSSAHFGITRFRMENGPAAGMAALQVKTDKGLNLLILADRGLDIARASYKGANLGLALAAGLKSPYSFTEKGNEGFLKQFFGGLLTTGGISYSGPGSEEHGLHGLVNNTPAENVNCWVDSTGDDVLLKVSGVIREARIFGHHLALHREITVNTESSAVEIVDRVENYGFMPAEIKLLYHINFGYPLLAPGCRIVSSAARLEARDAGAAAGLDQALLIEEASPGRAEQCYFHLDNPEEAFARLENSQLGLAATVNYRSSECPLLCEWKLMAAGDYALGLEPAGPAVFDDGLAVKTLAAGESCHYHVSIVFEELN